MQTGILEAYEGLGECGPLQVTLGLVCRGEGRFYAKCLVVAGESFSGLSCEAEASGNAVPAAAYPFTPGEKGERQTWVLDLPLLDAKEITVSVYPDGRLAERAEIKFNYGKVKWLSRLNYRTRAGACREVRDFERSFGAWRYLIDVQERFEGNDGAVWRFRVQWRGGSELTPQFSVFDREGAQLAAEVVEMEFDAGMVKVGSPLRTLYVSIILPRECDWFLVSACGAGPLAADGIAPGFAVVDRSRAGALAEQARERMKTADDVQAYSEWFDFHRAHTGDLLMQGRRMREDGPLMSVVLVPPETDGSTRTEASVASLRAQSYPRWELIVAGSREPGLPEAREAGSSKGGNRVCYTLVGGAEGRDKAVAEARGEFVVFLRGGDELEPDALYCYAAEISCGEDDARPADVLYCDEDRLLPGGGFAQPVFKSTLNLDLHYCGNWVGNLLAVRRNVLAELGVDASLSYQAWLYEVTLRAYERESSFRHVNRVLYHARECEVPVQELSGVLERHLMRRGIDATVREDSHCEGKLRTSYVIADPQPLVSVIIPSKDNIDLLDACLRSIIDRSTYGNYEIVVVENNSALQETFDYYREAESRWDCLRVCRWAEEFNYSKIVNYGAREARGDYLLLLNNDTEVIAPAFIEEMLGIAQRPEVGVVGAKLLFKDGLVQHAGIAVGVWGAVGHVNQNRALRDGGYLNRACLPGNYSAVTGACQMVRADAYRKLGGYDESFAVGFNDVDFCMRALEAGLLVSFTPHALLYHREFASRGRESADPEKMKRWLRERSLFTSRWPEPFLQGDRYTGPSLMKDNLHYRLV